jgi:triacylglycerol lipase
MKGTIARSAAMAVAVVCAGLGTLASARPAAAAPAPEPAALGKDAPRLPGEPACGPSLASPAEPQSGRNDNNSAAPLYFAPDFPVFADSDPNTGLGAVGGFGGIRRGAPLHHTPVIFVHGNQADAQNWLDVMLQFAASAGYTMQEMYALSYNGLGNYYAGAPTQMNLSPLDQDYITQNQNALANGGHGGGNDDNVPDLCRFVEAVQWYTGSRQVDVVTHSLGDTVARRLMEVYPSLAGDVVAFVGIAGGNHGTSVCTGLASSYYGCDEIAPGTDWLAYLNSHPAETYGPTQWMTVYDGAEGDPFFGPGLEQSPALAGADNRQFNSGVHGDYHNDLRVDVPEVDTYLAFLLRHGQAGPGAASGTGALAAQLDAAAQWAPTYTAPAAALCIPLLTGGDDGCTLPVAPLAAAAGSPPAGTAPPPQARAAAALPDTAGAGADSLWASLAAVLALSGCRCRRAPARRRTAPPAR